MNNTYTESAKRTITIERDAISDLFDRINNDFSIACELMTNCKGRVVVTGMGKSGHIAKKIAAHPLIAIETELDGLHRGTELSRSSALQHAGEQYIKQRKLHLATGHTAVDDLKNNKDKS